MPVACVRAPAIFQELEERIQRDWIQRGRIQNSKRLDTWELGSLMMLVILEADDAGDP
jgi:hypothetical protein